MTNKEQQPDGEIEECPECGWPAQEPDTWQSACIDDLCHGGEVPCMHGDYEKLPCGIIVSDRGYLRDYRMILNMVMYGSKYPRVNRR